MTEVVETEGLKFCPSCGYEGTDIICPVCNQKMESLDAEIEKLAEKEESKDLTDDAGLDDLSLEEEAQKENVTPEEEDAE